MIDKLDQFITAWNNVTDAGDTPENKGQCVGLIELWTDSLSLPHTWGNAADLLTNADKNSFDIIDNTPEAIIQRGDIPVWNAKYNGNYGHTGIATGNYTDANQFECFEQNDPLQSTPHLKIYNYAYIDGWLRPKNLVLAPSSPAELVLNDNTRYNFGGLYGSQTLGAVKSLLSDLTQDRDGNLAQAQDLKRQLDACLAQQPSLKNPLAIFLFNLAKSLG